MIDITQILWNSWEGVMSFAWSQKDPWRIWHLSCIQGLCEESNKEEAEEDMGKWMERSDSGPDLLLV